MEGVGAKSTPTGLGVEKAQTSAVGEQPVGKVALELGPEAW